MRRVRCAGASSIRALLVWALMPVGLAVGHFSAHAQSLPSTNARAVPTYESVGLYWASPGGTAGCDVRFRKAGTGAWSQGLAMWYDSRDAECRGSLVHLAADTAYEVEMGLAGQAMARGLVFRTWPNQRPVAKTITVNSGSATLNVTEGGSASGYVVYQGAPGAVLDAGNAAQFNVTINASYVIVRGLALRGAQQDAIRISPNVKDVVIEDNDLSGWGRQRAGAWGVDMDSGIRAVCTQPTMERVTIQRNRIHDPRYSANSWSDGHPAGPQAITISYCGGNHVIRHNEMYSTSGRYFNDVIGGEDNFTRSGFPNADTDIYANRISHAWDDGIEAEGANENVRIWGNYIDRTAIGVATTVTSIGPAYIFRNVWNRSQFYEKAALDSDDRQPFFKSGSDASLGNGRRYVFHNTMLQATQAGTANGLGGGFGMGGTGAAQLINNTFSKNNIYHLWKPGKSAFYQAGTGNDISNELYNGTPGDASIVNGINGTPAYVPGHGWVSEAGGNYQLAATSPGHDRGVRIANFNDAFTGAAPDVGAHESSTASMAFGIAASPGAAVSATSPGPSTFALSVAKAGTGGGTVTSAPAGINCGSTCTATLAAGAAVTVIATPAAGSTFAGWSGNCSGTGMCTVTMSAAAGITATFSANSSQPSLVTHFYSSILQRAPDAGGKAYWDSEVARLALLGASPNEVWYAMAAAFFFSPEYAARRRDHSGFVSDLYVTFFNRAPDAGGLSYWSGQIAAGMPREVALASFMFSPEFGTFTRSLFGSAVARAEVDMVMDLYRGLLARLPDAQGFSHWVQQFRSAQCQGAGAVYGVMEGISSAFLNSGEFAGRGRGHAQLVGDLYNALLRRGGDLSGVQFWIGQLATGAQSPNQVRQAFLASPETAARVSAIVAQGCIS